MMKVSMVVLTAAVVVLAGCGGSGPEDGTATTAGQDNNTNHAAETAASATAPMIVDGHQIVRVIVRNTGYDPDRVTLHAGMPAKFIFVQEGTSECSSKVQMPDLGVGVTELPEGVETVIDFTPEKAGTFSFTCGMDMLRGTIVVES